VGYTVIQVGGLFIEAGSDKKALVSSDEDCQGLQLSEAQDEAHQRNGSKPARMSQTVSNAIGAPSFSPYRALFAILYSDDEPD
jgi:hypothetical protein